jgi:hypothetical protein
LMFDGDGGGWLGREIIEICAPCRRTIVGFFLKAER